MWDSLATEFHPIVTGPQWGRSGGRQMDDPGPPKVSIDALLPAARFSVQQVAALLMCFLVVAMDGYDTQTLSFVAVDMKQKLGIDPAQLGVAFAISQFSGVLGGLAAGPFVDRTGRRPWIIGASFAFGASTLLYPWVTDLTQLLALRFVTGALAAISINVSYTYAAEIAPRSFSARAVVFATIGYA
ncbi:MAG: aromatic acid/H+ symport family transporter, partial [Phenylobacterium sp.]|nr:aromatic acid/H+ symport family transporter [Phenylobacterium sp.]